MAKEDSAKKLFGMFEGVEQKEESSLAVERTRVQIARPEFLDEAQEIYEEVGTLEREDGLYKMGAIQTDFNAATGILAKFLGEDDEAEQIHEEIGEKIGKYKILYKESTSNGINPAVGNALMGILSFYLGREEEAGAIYDEAKASIGRKDGLYNRSGSEVSRSSRSLFQYAEGSALMGVLGKLLGKDDEAEELYRRVNEKIGKHNGLYRRRSTSDEPKDLDGNASMAMLCLLLGKEEEAEEIYQKCRKPAAGYFRSVNYTDRLGGVLMGVYRCMKAMEKH